MTVPQRAYPQTLRQCQGCGVFGYKKKLIATSILQRESVGVPLDGAAGERQGVIGLAKVQPLIRDAPSVYSDACVAVVPRRFKHAVKCER